MSPYQLFVSGLNDDELGRLIRGEAGIGCDDNGYRLEEGGPPLFADAPGTEQVQKQLAGMEAQILAHLYQARPLCRSEFDYQASALLDEHGAARFCRNDGNSQNWALMIDDWHLVVVPPDDVRSQYGYFCECDGLVDEAESQVMRWLKSGDAYGDYRAKTHCRYCM